MRKILLVIGLFYGLVSVIEAGYPIVYFEQTSLTPSSTYYLLIDRSDTSNFGHYFTGTGHTLYIKSLEVHLSSNTTLARIGMVYSVNASTAQVRWFDRYERRTADEPINVVKTYSGSGMQIRYTNENFVLPLTQESLTTAHKLYIYDTSQTQQSVAAGDLIVYTEGSGVVGTNLFIKVIYNIR